MESVMQRVWRTATHSSQNGYFVWDVMEVIGTPFDEKYFVKCRDDSFIMIMCMQTWTIEAAGSMLHGYDRRLQILEVIE